MIHSEWWYLISFIFSIAVTCHLRGRFYPHWLHQIFLTLSQTSYLLPRAGMWVSKVPSQCWRQNTMMQQKKESGGAPELFSYSSELVVQHLQGKGNIFNSTIFYICMNTLLYFLLILHGKFCVWYSVVQNMIYIIFPY